MQSLLMFSNAFPLKGPYSLWRNPAIHNLLLNMDKNSYSARSSQILRNCNRTTMSMSGILPQQRLGVQRMLCLLRLEERQFETYRVAKCKLMNLERLQNKKRYQDLHLRNWAELITIDVYGDKWSYHNATSTLLVKQSFVDLEQISISLPFICSTG